MALNTDYDALQQQMMNAQRGPRRQYDQAQLGNRAVEQGAFGGGFAGLGLGVGSLFAGAIGGHPGAVGAAPSFGGIDLSAAGAAAWHPNKPSLSVEYGPPTTVRRMKKWPKGTAVWQTVPRRRHPIRYLLRLPGRFWRALTWGSRNGYQKPKRMSRRAWRNWEDIWGPRDGNWERYYKKRRVYA